MKKKLNFSRTQNFNMKTFHCEYCISSFTQKCSKTRHILLKHKECVRKCECCTKQFASKNSLKKHLKRKEKKNCRFCRRNFSSHYYKVEHEKNCDKRKAENSSQELIWCVTCKKEVKKAYFYHHQRSLDHLNLSMVKVSEKIKKFQNCFNKKLCTYKIDCVKKKHEFDTVKFLQDSKKIVTNFLRHELIERKCYKYKVTLISVFHRQSEEEAEFEESVKNFSSNFRIISSGDDISSKYQESIDEVKTASQEFSHRNSGWSILKNLYIMLDLVTFNLRVGKFIALTPTLRAKNCLKNFKNLESSQNNKCFLYCVAYHCFHKKIEKKNREKASSYEIFFKKFNTKNISFPITTNDITKFEKQNTELNLSINVYTYEKKTFGVLRLCQNEKKNHLNLLLLEKKKHFHFVYIENLSRLVRSQVTKHNGAHLFCAECITHFKPDDFLMHKTIGCGRTKIEPPKDPFVKFTKFYAKNPLKFIVYADLETKNVVLETQPGKNLDVAYTEKLTRHEVIAASYKIVSFNDDENYRKLRTFICENPLSKFFNKLLQDLTEIKEKYYSFNHPMTKISPEHRKYLEREKNCRICEKPLYTKSNEPIVIDHDHCLSEDDCSYRYGPFKGNIRFLVHNSCNINFVEKHFFVVCLHNNAHYDGHFLIRYLATLRLGNLTCIARSSENYICFKWKLYNTTHELEIRFIDSYKFLSSSLSNIISSMTEFPYFDAYMKRKFGNKVVTKDFLLKAPMCYSHIKSLKVLEEKDFPSRDKFFNSLTNTELSIEDYDIGKKIYKSLGCKKFKDYFKFYLHLDVIFLTDGCEALRKMLIGNFKIDPLGYYFTLASYSLDACLHFSNLELPVLYDCNMIRYARKAIKGGYCGGNIHYIESNSRHSNEGFCEEKGEESQILAFDVVGLYSKIMKDFKFPFGGYEWIKDNCSLKKLEKDLMNIPLNGDIGYLIDADIDVPENLHNLHAMWPLLPETKKMKDKSFKLLATLLDKKNYVCHFGLLQQAVKNGLKLKKINSAIKFNQTDWLKPYMTFVLELRQKATTKNEQDILKFLLNSIYGKFIENTENYMNYRLLMTHDSEMVKNRLFSNPRMKNVKIFSKNLCGVEITKDRVCYPRSPIVANAILDLSKMYMAGFVYDLFIPNLKNDFKILYSDSDSFFLWCRGEKGYDLIRNNPEIFDTSDFSPSNSFGIKNQNNKLPGSLKIENANYIIIKFIYLRPKAYAIIMVDAQGNFKVIKKAKGTEKAIIHSFTFNDYLDVFNKRNHIMKKMTRIMSKNHEVFTVETNKKALSSGCNKRCFDGKGNSKPWGHKKIKSEELPFLE